ncbi:hypothetical protein ACSTK8_24395 [Vibrio parahaemolyticus]
MSKYTAKKDKFSQGQGNGLNTSKASKIYNFTNGEQTATRIVLSAGEVETKTEKHPLNPRNQKALNERSLAKTLASVREDGITEDCLGIWKDKDRTVIQIIKGSSRRWCAIKAGVDYPVWVLPAGCATNDDIRKLIANDELQRPHSYRERGEAIVEQLKERGLDFESMKNEEIAAELGIGRETVRKCMQAYRVNNRLLELIPDYESVKQPVYGKLAKLERALDKDPSKSINHVANAVKMATIGIEKLDTEEAQEKVIGEIEKAILGKGGADVGWTVTELAKFDSSRKKARKHVSPDGRNVKFELNRQDPELIEAVENLIREHAKKRETDANDK